MRTDLRPESHLLYLEALARGGFERGEAPHITGLAERTAREVLSNLVKEGFLLSDTPKGRVRAGFPVKALGTFLPNLYPAGDLDFVIPG
jgi:Fic family protein